MLNWIITVFMLAVASAVLGFGGMTGALADFAQLLAVIFIALFAGSLVCGIIWDAHSVPAKLK